MRRTLLALTALVATLLPLGATSAAEPPSLPLPITLPGLTDTTPVVWLCKPGLRANPCEIKQDTTHLRFDGSSRVSKPKRLPSKKRPVDCFYVYPTVSNQVGINTTKAKDPEIRSIAKYQASRFSQVCRMYAPVYRQAPLAGLATIPLSVPTAYADVRQAWKTYLRQHNKGRGVILIGHSQGTLMLRKLIAEEIDRTPSVRKRVVGAFLMGGNVTVAKGRTTGGDFDRVPLCTERGQIRCVVAYSTYSTDPLPISFFGNTGTDVITPAAGLRTGPSFEVACTDPRRLSGIKRPAGVTIPSEPFAQGPINLGIVVTNGGQPPSPDTTWVRLPDRATGACRTINNASVYRFEPTEGSKRPAEFPPTWGTHLIDMNLGLERLVRIARLQTRNYLR